MSQVDMSLDDIIKSNKINKFGGPGGSSGRRGSSGSGGNRGRGSGNRGNRNQGPLRDGVGTASFTRKLPDGQWHHDLYQEDQGRPLVRQLNVSDGPIKLNIANLDFGVSDEDMRELFCEFSSFRSAAVHYDRTGRSLGTAHALLGSRAQGLVAVRKYNGVFLDGIPMKITVGDSDGPLMGARDYPVKRLAQRMRPAVDAGRFGGRARGSGSGRARSTQTGGDRGKGGQTKDKAPSAAELDAELDAYVSRFKKSEV